MKPTREIEQKGWDRAARVTVGLANKQRHSNLVIHFKGTPRNPLSHSEVEDKARKLTHRLLSERQLDGLVEAVDQLEKIDDVSRIGDLLRQTPMKIVAIDTYPLVLPVQEIYGGAAGFLEDCRSLIVRVETENGIEGWGEATQGRPGNTYETLETMEIMARKYFAPALIGWIWKTPELSCETSSCSPRPSDHKGRHRDGSF